MEPIKEIYCPRCKGLARFEQPYEFIGGPTPKANSPLWKLPRHGGVGGWFVREKFPSLIPWKGSEEYVRHAGFLPGDPLLGVVLCSKCGDARIHELRWPQDAFWQWEVRGGILWAYSKEYALVLRDFISRTHRDPVDFGVEYQGFLRTVPSVFLRASLREKIVKKIDDSLASVEAV